MIFLHIKKWWKKIPRHISRSRISPQYQNKTASYNRHIYCFPIFAKKAFKKLKVFFSITHSFIILSIFSNFRKILISCQNTAYMKWQTFLRKIISCYAFYSKVETFSNFENKIKFISKKRLFFKKNPKFEILRNVNLSVTFYGKFSIT